MSETTALPRGGVSDSGPQREPAGPGAVRRFPNARRAVRAAAPAVAGYAAVRAVGLLLLWMHPGPGSALQRITTLWDAVYYRDVALHGYSDDLGMPGYENGVPYSSRAFFPLYPALIRAVHEVLRLDPGGSALLVTWTASLVAAAGIFALGSHLYGHRAGTVAAVLWGVLPHAVVESYAYSEALFTALAVWSLYAVVTRRWVWAGAISTLSCLTRPTGMAVAAAVVVAAAWCLVGHLRGRGGDVHWSRPLLGAVLAPLGWLGYVGYVGWARGEWNGYFRVQSAWDSHFDGGITTARWLKAMLIGQGHRSTQLDQVVMVLVVLAAVFLFAVTLVQRHPLPLLVFTATSLLIALGNGAFYAPRARFLVPAVTLLLPAAVGLAKARSKLTLAAVLACAALASGMYGVFLTFRNPFSP
ncbi:glycosyltransferase family 39 protein [Kitasatospora arboriphila]|uniref:Glycosyltransferase family 39 protein n=1 Tax=Kitasatospora arboriphila TaxID=258052 RepID=A0ABN1U246_9ACTN